ncbi:MAG: helix-turn-helix transcriptional regulator [Candidatus Aminicenantes bacterium]|nr:MAG: helix-turn-helix transcriptional regulator [Candidatus Aminicenantes bacterium]
MNESLLTDIGKRIQEVRRILGLQQNEMANAVGLNPGYLSEIENGHKHNPGIATLYKISSHYNVSLDYLVHGIGHMFLPDKESDEKKSQDIFNGLENIEDVTWLMKNSRFIKNTLLAYAEKMMIENESVIKTEILRQREKEGEKTDGSDDDNRV